MTHEMKVMESLREVPKPPLGFEDTLTPQAT